jgi:hypothetical protein
MKTKIKTVKDAFVATGRDIKIMPDVSALPEKDRKFIESHYKLTVVAEALNQEANDGKPWIPDWSNWGERKYYPWFEISKNEDGSGFGFSGTDFVFDGTGTLVGSRLCFLSSELALYAAKQFEELYKDYFLIQ